MTGIYKLRQISGVLIPRHHHGDSLNEFRLRGCYLITGEEESLPVFENSRFGRSSFKLSRGISSMMEGQFSRESWVAPVVCQK